MTMTRLGILWMLFVVKGLLAAGSDFFNDPFRIRHSQSKLYLDENGQLTKNVFLSEQFLLKRSCHKGSVYFIAQTSGKLLTVKGGCGNTVISLEPKRLTQNQRFDFLDGAHITSKCDPTSIVGLADNNETLAVKKNDPADYTKNRIVFEWLHTNI
ncbi:uncharacterized protein LOC132696833 [Cylas formicarius]|uniref:uncharacterized protein LOC132696833 n=1 Tax=Cylas formicarius TaxID=197179 RepID=UPI00295895F5|nr:uncharacterized protein LOC132696833 [Cylas formicarius]